MSVRRYKIFIIILTYIAHTPYIYQMKQFSMQNFSRKTNLVAHATQHNTSGWLKKNGNALMSTIYIKKVQFKYNWQK